MKSQLMCLLATLAAFFGLGGCSGEKHPGAELLTQVIEEEIKAYQAAKLDCPAAEAKLKAFYSDSAWHKRAAQASVTVIQNNFTKKKEFRNASVRMIKAFSTRLDDACFEFKSSCRGNQDYLTNLKTSAGKAIKKDMDTIDVGAVSRLYNMDEQFKKFIQDGYLVRDEKVEARLKGLERNRIEKQVEAALGKSITGD
ncbi:MAG: hypothetical protein JRJ87_26325 [Deltaproteobacteria bacterium]|nr:hypothetical protein [Deltaproteobacteria bacterium]